MGNEAHRCLSLRLAKSIDVSGVSKGHGFTGAIQRWNQHTGPMAHGSKYHRGVGSMSANSDPSRVFKNKHMPGQYGRGARDRTQNLEIVRVDAERNLLLITRRAARPQRRDASAGPQHLQGLTAPHIGKCKYPFVKEEHRHHA